MICDNIKNINRYYDVDNSLKTALNKIKECSSNSIGKYEIDGKNLFLNISSYETSEKEEYIFENHKKYIDVQYILSGEEKILVRENDDSFLYQKYDEEIEAEFYKFSFGYTEIILSEGDFLILFPGETHSVGFCIDKPKVVKKIVAKVHI